MTCHRLRRPFERPDARQPPPTVRPAPKLRHVAPNPVRLDTDQRVVPAMALVADHLPVRSRRLLLGHPTQHRRRDAPKPALHRPDPPMSRVSRSAPCTALYVRCVRPSLTLVILPSGSCGCFQSLFGTVFSRHRSNRSDSTRAGVGTPDCSVRRRTDASKKMRRPHDDRRSASASRYEPHVNAATCVSSGLRSSRSKNRCPVFAGRPAVNALAAAVLTPPPSCPSPCGAVYGTRSIWSSPSAPDSRHGRYRIGRLRGACRS